MVFPTLNTAVPETTLIENTGLLGRKMELKSLLKNLTLCRNGQGKSVLLSASTGLGKTALLQAFCTLAHEHYGTGTIELTLTGGETSFRQVLKTFCLTLKQQAERIVEHTLSQINPLLAQADIVWSASDVIQAVSMVQLQQAITAQQRVGYEQIQQGLSTSLTLHKKKVAQFSVWIADLAHHLSDPYLMFWVLLLSPANSVFYGLLEALEQSEADATQLSRQWLTLFQNFNKTLQQQQSAIILSFDDGECLAGLNELELNRFKNAVTQLCKDVFDQRDNRILFVFSCRSEQESLLLAGSLYNSLRLKILLGPLSREQSELFLKHRLKQLPSLKDSLRASLLEASAGNVAALDMLAFLLEKQPASLAHLKSYAELITPYKSLTQLFMARLRERINLTPPPHSLLQWFGQKGALPERSLGEILREEGFILGQKNRWRNGQLRHALWKECYSQIKTGGGTLPVSSQATPRTPEILKHYTAQEWRSVLTQEAVSLEDLAILMSSLPTFSELESAEIMPLLAQYSEQVTVARGLLGLMNQASENLALILLKVLPNCQEPEMKLSLERCFASFSEHPNLTLAEVACEALKQSSPLHSETLHGLLEKLPSAQQPQHCFFTLSILVLNPLSTLEKQKQDAVLTWLAEQLGSVERYSLSLKCIQKFSVARQQPILLKRLEQNDNLSIHVALALVNHLVRIDFASALPWINLILLSSQAKAEHKIPLIRRLGASSHYQSEMLLVGLLQEESLSSDEILVWSVIRSLGWIAQTQEAYFAVQLMSHKLIRNDLIYQSAMAAMARIESRLGRASITPRGDNEMYVAQLSETQESDTIDLIALTAIE
jgi:hypothetical protein